MQKRRLLTYFHLHLVSDSTGETINAVAKAAAAQFDRVQPIEHAYALVRSERQLERVIDDIEAAPGVVLFTLVNQSLRERLERACADLGIPCISVMDVVLDMLSRYLGRETTHRPGGQHQLDAEYFQRIEAMNYTMMHDDGQNTGDLDSADIVLLGVSRTSKTPTCIYLANRGYRAANIPLVPGVPLPETVFTLKRPLVIGLIASPERLVQIRRNRLLSLAELKETAYVDPTAVREEMANARRIFEQLDCPVIDVTRRSIEETAAAILNHFSAHVGV